MAAVSSCIYVELEVTTRLFTMFKIKIQSLIFHIVISLKEKTLTLLYP